MLLGGMPFSKEIQHLKVTVQFYSRAHKYSHLQWLRGGFSSSVPVEPPSQHLVVRSYEVMKDPRVCRIMSSYRRGACGLPGAIKI